MNAHRIETILTEKGTLTLRNLPFQEGDAVEVIILKRRIPRQEKATTSDSDASPYPLRGKVIHYDNSTDPVALDDWEVLQ